MTRTFAQIIRQHALDRPQAPALTFEGVTLSFAQLDASSSQSHCRARGYVPVTGSRCWQRTAPSTTN
jgi:hypothetical protein